MLTKQEREEISERIKVCNDMCRSNIYKCLFGKYPKINTSIEEDGKAIKNRLIDLCDTSNMVELPRDKDGVSFKVGDMIYDPSNKQYKVNGYVFVNDCWKIIVAFSSESSFASIYANDLTHKKPVTVASLARDIRNVLAEDFNDMPLDTSEKLMHIIYQLEKLGDNDD